MHRHTQADYDPLFSCDAMDTVQDETMEHYVAMNAAEAPPLHHQRQRPGPVCGTVHCTAYPKQTRFVVTDECRASAHAQMRWLLPAILDNGCAGNEWALNRYAQLDAMAYPRTVDGIIVLDNRALDSLLAELNTLGRFLAMTPKNTADAETIAWARRRHDQADGLFITSRRVKTPVKQSRVLDAALGYVHDNPTKVGALLGIVLGVPLGGALFSLLNPY
ncbi:hypothetical protein pmac_cds_591 [Pandoravirus macleodensis]|uniref:Uncharacterized protein n=1 Tax=Pandoravirus macleodensis TaxID=2107707 RepID=A0A2U7UFL7_9VIRU|nr:hypothetical protein pmac_cds_591 [Pandoravirus macleodensis]AVK77279.1 hypothetical protein pmac_cds_591 [Pandoravirus macleodensis]